MAAGFFTVLILEKMVLSCRQMRGAHGERAPLLSENGHGHGHSHAGAVTTADLESSGHHVHVDFQAHSPFRSFMLFLSLSLHSVFEGLAIGLQNTDSKVRRWRALQLRYLPEMYNIIAFFLQPYLALLLFKKIPSQACVMCFEKTFSLERQNALKTNKSQYISLLLTVLVNLSCSDD